MFNDSEFVTPCLVSFLLQQGLFPRLVAGASMALTIKVMLLPTPFFGFFLLEVMWPESFFVTLWICVLMKVSDWSFSVMSVHVAAFRLFNYFIRNTLALYGAEAYICFFAYLQCRDCRGILLSVPNLILCVLGLHMLAITYSV